MKITEKQSKGLAHETARQDQASTRADLATENGFDLFMGDGFQMRIPQAYSRNIQSDEDKQREYGEFFSPFPQDDQERAEIEGVFYYWTKDKKTKFGPQTIAKLCRRVVNDHLFEPGFDLQIVDSFETEFGRFPALVLRYRYKFKSYQAAGPLHVFAVDNIDQRRLFILGLLTERSGESWREAQTIQFLEDTVLMSFQFC